MYDAGRQLLVVAMATVITALAPSTARAAPEERVLLPDLPKKPQVTDADKATAKEAYAAVEDAWSAGDLAKALQSADEAFRAVPNASTAILRATVLGELKRPREAFKALLVASDLDPTPQERAAIAEGLAKHGVALPSPMGWARVAVEPPDAEVLVDGVRFRAPRTVGLALGDHAVHVSAPGSVPADATLSVPAAGEVEARFRLEQEPVLPVAPDPPPVIVPSDEPIVTEREPAAGRGTPVLPWVLVGGGAALIATGGGMHAWAIQAADDTSKYANTVEGLSDDDRKKKFDQANDDMKLRGTLAYVFYGVGGAAAVAGAVLLILDAVESDDAPVAFSPTAFPGGGGGILVRGGF